MRKYRVILEVKCYKDYIVEAEDSQEAENEAFRLYENMDYNEAADMYACLDYNTLEIWEEK